MTLMEVVAALTLLALLTVALTSLLVSVSGAARAVDRVGHSDQLASRALGLVRQDADEAWPGSIAVDPVAGTIEMVTTHALPGESAGWASVTWGTEQATSGKMALTRSRRSLEETSSTTARVILRGTGDLLLEPSSDDGDGHVLVSILGANDVESSVLVSQASGGAP